MPTTIRHLLVAVCLALLACGGEPPEEKPESEAASPSEPDRSVPNKEAPQPAAEAQATSPEECLRLLGEAAARSDLRALAVLIAVPSAGLDQDKHKYAMASIRFTGLVARAKSKVTAPGWGGLRLARAFNRFAIDFEAMAQDGKIENKGDHAIVTLESDSAGRKQIQLTRTGSSWRLDLNGQGVRGPLGEVPAPRMAEVEKMLRAFTVAINGYVDAVDALLDGSPSPEVARAGLDAAWERALENFPIISRMHDTLCKNNLKQLGLGLILYRDSQGKATRFPPHSRMLTTLFTAGVLEELEVYCCPGTGRTALAKAIKSHAADATDYEVTPYPIRSMRGSSERPVVWDRKDNHGGRRNVLFLDGHVETLTAAEFAALMKKLDARCGEMEGVGFHDADDK